MRIHIAHIRPDVNPAMNGLLKEQPGSQLFTVFGRPRTAVRGPDGDSMYTVEMEGVDVYDPVNNSVVDTARRRWRRGSWMAITMGARFASRRRSFRIAALGRS
jgi:hypothetical protein